MRIHANHLSIKLNLTNRFGSYATPMEKLVHLKPRDSVQRPRVRRYSLKSFLSIFWNSSGVLHDRLLAASLMLTPTTTRYRRIMGASVCKTMLVSTRQIKENLLFYVGLLRLSRKLSHFQNIYVFIWLLHSVMLSGPSYIFGSFLPTVDPE